MKKQDKRIARHKRVRAQIKGTDKRPRLSVFRSNAHVWAQLIDDSTGKTLVAASDTELKGKKQKGKLVTAEAVGKNLADKAKDKKIETVVFDRGGYKYHGIIRALAEGARKQGLKF